MKRELGLSVLALLVLAAAPEKAPMNAPEKAPMKAPMTAPATAAKPALQPPPVAPAPPGPAALIVAMPPVPAHDALRKLLLKPYEDASQSKLAEPVWNGGEPDTQKLLAGLKQVAPDIALVDGEAQMSGCRSGQFRKLDWGRLNRDRYLGQATSDCGAGAYVSATALAWDTDKFATPPLWADFWDVVRHPGRRGLQRTARGNLEIALLADGVSAGDVYRTLRSGDGLDRAFRKLDQLKPYIQWWDAPGEPGQWLAAGKVLLTSAPAESVSPAGKAAHKHLTVQWAGSLTRTESFVVPQGAPHPGAAAIALAIAADPARQAMLAEATGLGPAVKDAVDLLPPVVHAENAAAPQNLAGSLAVDEAFWTDNGDRLEARFAAWLSK